MIPVFLRDMRWRLVVLVGIALVFYLQEPGFHQHEGFNPDAAALGPLGISATLSNFAALSMIILLEGFISRDLREGYTRINFSRSIAPTRYFGLQWIIAYLLTILAAAAFLVAGQLLAWGEFLGGWQGMILPVVSALMYGGLMAVLSGAGVRGEATIAFLLLLIPAVFPEILSALLGMLPAPLQNLVNTVLPPQTALSDLWDGLITGVTRWDAVAYGAGYGVILLAVAALILRLREWP
ncbi:MAG: hypothetical protein LBG44_11015 [Gemmatimonadota bacterium]|jgi:hypothetical protein|nr:hypothetical protein [Gemmatimonadota bacterium]